MKQAVKTLIESLKAKRPGYSRALREMAEAGLMSPDAQMEAPMGDAPADDAAGGVDHVDAILTAAAACLRDESLDPAGKIAKIKKLLAMTAKDDPGAAGGKGGKGDACPPGDKKDDDPGAKGGKGDGDEDKKEMESLRLQLKARDLLMEAGLRPSKVLSKALDGCKNEAEVKEIIEAGRTSGQTVYHGARSGTPPPVGKVNEAKIPEKPGEWGRSLRE